MLAHISMSVTVDELWEARNGLLHTGTAESSANQRDTTIRKVIYTVGGAECTRNDDPTVVFVNAGELFGHYLTAAIWFLESLKTDEARMKVALSKLDRILHERGLQEA